MTIINNESPADTARDKIKLEIKNVSEHLLGALTSVNYFFLNSGVTAQEVLDSFGTGGSAVIQFIRLGGDLANLADAGTFVDEFASNENVTLNEDGTVTLA